MLLVAAMALALQRAEPWDTVSEALKFLARHQRPDGSWGERPETCTCPRDEAGATAVAAYPMISIFNQRFTKDPLLPERVGRHAETLETEDLYFADLGVPQYDGPKGAIWKAWLAKIRERVLLGQVREDRLCTRGSWDGIGLRGRLRMFQIDFNH